MGHIIYRATVALVFSAAIAFAGLNRDAVLFIDCVPATPAIDSTGMCLAESSFTAGIFIRNANKMYSYQYSIAYDTSRLRFVKALKGNADCSNFLESKGQSISFKSNRELADSTHILIAGWLSGDDTSQCADGAGCLALVTFSKRTNDTASLSLAKIILIDCSLDDDTACVSHGALVVPGTMGVLAGRKDVALREKFDFANGIVRFTAPVDPDNFRATISDVSGREIRRFTRGSTVMEADMRSAARGIYFVSIVHGGRISSYPLVIGR